MILFDEHGKIITQLANFASGYEMLQLHFDKMDVVEEADHRVRPNIGRVCWEEKLGTLRLCETTHMLIVT
jgi:hypothetical protein